MATSRKKPGAPARAASEKPVRGAPARTKSAAPAAVAKPPARPVGPRKPAAVKAVDPALQASKQALADALAAAKAVKIEKPLTPLAGKSRPEVQANKPKKAKPVKDNFTMPEDEYARIAALKKRLLAQGIAAKKNEVLRAGIALLAALADTDLVAALDKIGAGRPAKPGK